MTTGTELFWKLIPIITSALALVVIYVNVRFGIRNKQADLIIHFNKQFDELQKKKCELLTGQCEATASTPGAWSQQRIDREAQMFFDRFWSLQFDEFVAWYEGYVPTRLYVYWAFSRWRELNKAQQGSDDTLCGKTMRSTLAELNNRWQSNPDRKSKLSIHVSNFLGLMNTIKQNAATADIDKLLRTHGPNLGTRWARWFFGAY